MRRVNLKVLVVWSLLEMMTVSVESNYAAGKARSEQHDDICLLFSGSV